VDARALADGTPVRITGVLTTALGAIDSGRNGFVQDATAGIALRLDAPLPAALPAGSTVIVDGTLGSYFSLRVVSVTAASVTVTGVAELPEPVGAATGAATESLEGLRLLVAGTVSEAPSALSDGLGVTIDDGTGPLRLVVGPDALGGATIHTGDVVTAIGPLGQRDSSGTGAAGYRLHPTAAGELAVDVAGPSPTPTPSPSASPTPVPSPTPSITPSTPPSATPAPSGTSTASPSPTPPPTTPITEIRARVIGAAVAVEGVVTAQPGRLGTPALVAIEDATGGIVLRLPDDAPMPALGSRVAAAGVLADPYGQLEVRGLTAFAILGTGPLPTPRAVTGAALGESTEARLVTLSGTVEGRPVKSTSGDLAIVVTTANGSARVLADASAGLPATFVAKGDIVRIVGVGGQHASRKGALDGYRVWLRGSGDVVRTGSVVNPSPSSPPSGHASASPSPSRTIAAAIAAGSGDVTIVGVVTAPAALLDSTHRRIVVQDPTAAIEILLPASVAPPSVGRRVRIAGEVGKAYGAPRIRAASLATLGTDAISPIELRAGPTATIEWRLVKVRGDVVAVHRSGDRWTAELLVAGVRVLVIGLPGAGIASSAIVEGRTAAIVGIVRRPYPSATERRFAIVPRTARDLTLGGRAEDGAGGPGSTGSGSGHGVPAGAAGTTTLRDPLDANLIDLSERVGTRVRVGGLVQSVQPDGFTLDDGTAVARIRLVGAATELGGSIVVGDALSATGVVVRDAATGEVRVDADDPAAIVLAGDLGGAGSGTDVQAFASAAAPQGIASPHPIALGGALTDAVLPEVSAVGIVLLSIASLAVTLLRRRRTRRRLGARIAARLAAIAASPGPSEPARAGAAPRRTAMP
jgi:hypothetical protein